MSLGLQVFRHHHQTGGVFVQPVDYARPRHLLQVGQIVQQAIEQGPLLVARRRMHHQIRRFIDYQEVFVFVNGRQGQILRLPIARVPQFDLQLHHLTAGDFGIGFGGPPGEGDLAGFDPLLQARAGKLREQYNGHLIQTLAAEVEGNTVLLRDLLLH